MRPLSASAMAIVACALTSVVAVAQTRPATPARPNRAAQPAPTGSDSQPGMRRGGPNGPRSGPGGSPADQMLRLRQQLDLTDDQVAKLEALRSAPRPSVNEADMLRARADLMDATKGDVNTEKARAAFDRMSRIRTDVQIAQLRSRQDARNVLTVAQRTKLDAVATNMRSRRGAAQRGGAMRDRAGQPRRAQVRGQQGFGPPGAGRQGFRGAPGARPGMGAPVGQGLSLIHI